MEMNAQPSAEQNNDRITIATLHHVTGFWLQIFQQQKNREEELVASFEEGKQKDDALAAKKTRLEEENRMLKATVAMQQKTIDKFVQIWAEKDQRPTREFEAETVGKSVPEKTSTTPLTPSLESSIPAGWSLQRTADAVIKEDRQERNRLIGRVMELELRENDRLCRQGRGAAMLNPTSRQHPAIAELLQNTNGMGPTARKRFRVD